MNDEKLYTEREKVMAQRDAVVLACSALDSLSPNGVMRNIHMWEGSLNLAVRLYPMPKVLRPRVVTLQRAGWPEAFDYSIRHGQLQYRRIGGESLEWTRSILPLGDCDPAFLIAIGELAADPMEMVNDGSTA